MKGDLGVERRSVNKVGYKAYNFQKDNLKTKDWIKMSRKLVLDCKAFQIVRHNITNIKKKREREKEHLLPKEITETPTEG